jgi:hypothetical protein
VIGSKGIDYLLDPGNIPFPDDQLALVVDLASASILQEDGDVLPDLEPAPAFNALEALRFRLHGAVAVWTGDELDDLHGILKE